MRGRIAAMALGALLVAGCTAPSSGAQGPPAAQQAKASPSPVGSASASPRTASSPTGDATCDPVRTHLEVDGLPVPDRRRLTVQIGQRIHLVATGSCGYTVNGDPQNLRVLRVVIRDDDPSERSRTFRAVRAGRSRLVMTMPMCARPATSTGPFCLGGISPLRTVHVLVRAPGR